MMMVIFFLNWCHLIMSGDFLLSLFVCHNITNFHKKQLVRWPRQSSTFKKNNKEHICCFSYFANILFSDLHLLCFVALWALWATVHTFFFFSNHKKRFQEFRMFVVMHVKQQACRLTQTIIQITVKYVCKCESRDGWVPFSCFLSCREACIEP